MFNLEKCVDTRRGRIACYILLILQVRGTPLCRRCALDVRATEMEMEVRVAQTVTMAIASWDDWEPWMVEKGKHDRDYYVKTLPFSNMVP